MKYKNIYQIKKESSRNRGQKGWWYGSKMIKGKRHRTGAYKTPKQAANALDIRLMTNGEYPINSFKKEKTMGKNNGFIMMLKMIGHDEPIERDDNGLVIYQDEKKGLKEISDIYSTYASQILSGATHIDDAPFEDDYYLAYCVIRGSKYHCFDYAMGRSGPIQGDLIITYDSKTDSYE